MKNLKTILFIVICIGAFTLASAQRSVVRVYPKHGTVVTTIHKPRLVIHKKHSYYLSNGIWYKTKGRRYVVVNAPIGIKIKNLPRGNKVVVINGRKLYKYKGVWYKKSGRHYKVVNV